MQYLGSNWPKRSAAPPVGLDGSSQLTSSLPVAAERVTVQKSGNGVSARSVRALEVEPKESFCEWWFLFAKWVFGDGLTGDWGGAGDGAEESNDAGKSLGLHFDG